MPLEKKQLDDKEDPEQKFTAFANRDNSDFKWQRARNVVGVLEIYSEPVLKPREELKPRYMKGRETLMKEALVAWEKADLRKDLIDALENLPVETCCCGLMHLHDSSKKEIVKLLKANWIKKANKKLQRYGFKLDVFLWTWQNASGKAETNIILVRFFVVATYGLRAASQSGGLLIDDADRSHKSIDKTMDEFNELNKSREELRSAEMKLEKNPKLEEEPADSDVYDA